MPTYAHIQTDQTDSWYRILKYSDLDNWLETYKDQMSPTQREMLNID